MKSKFLFTDQKEIADKLLSYGYKLIVNSNNQYYFENNTKLVFDDTLHNVCFTNILCI